MNLYLSHWPRYVLLFKKEEKTDVTKRNFVVSSDFYRPVWIISNGTVICFRPKADLVAEYHSTKEYNLIPPHISQVGFLKHSFSWPQEFAVQTQFCLSTENLKKSFQLSTLTNV